MSSPLDTRAVHPDFEHLLGFKEASLIDLFRDVRQFVLTLYPDSVELLYHTHALTAVFSTSERLSDAFCMIPIYSKHLNLGFNKGTLIDDPEKLLQGTGKLIRHIPITKAADYRNKATEALIRTAIQFAINDMEKPAKLSGVTISKIATK